MCTIGNVFSKIDNAQLVFKQCDLVDKVEFYKPEIKTNNITGISYVPFMRKGSEGAWCGVNNYGVSFVAADSYIDEQGKEQLKKSFGNPIFDQYMKIISECTTATEATEMMKEFYTKKFDEPDILLIADGQNSFFIEAYGSKEKGVQIVQRKNGHFASTNHFRMVYGAVPYYNNHSTYLRLQRAESVLQSQPSLEGVQNVLKDRYYGDSVWSVCRTANADTPPEEAKFFTQASAIFVINDENNQNGLPKIDCYYQINGNPETNNFYHWQDIFEV